MAPFYEYIGDSGRDYPFDGYEPFNTGDVVDFANIPGAAPPADGRWTSNAGPATVGPVTSVAGAVPVRAWGTLAQRPSAAQLPQQRYFATDTGEDYFSDGANWYGLNGVTAPAPTLDQKPLLWDQTSGTFHDATTLLNGAYLPGAVPEAFGAAGDGTTDDTAALLAWQASGKRIALTPGKTYLHRHTIPLNIAGQKIDGNAATLKRAAQVVTTTTTAVTSGTTNQVTLASAAGLVVGDQIVIEQGGTYDTVARTVTAISGNQVTISGTFGVTLSGTTNVRTAGHQIKITASDVTVDNVQLDGNYTNWSWARWNHTAGIFADSGCDRGKVTRCHIFNQYGDAASPGNYRNFLFAFNVVENIKGRGISWAGSNSPLSVGGRCLFNTFDNCDLDLNVAGNDGHGNIQVSSYTSDLLIQGNYCTNGYNGVGAINSTDNSDISIIGNIIRTMSNYAIEGDNLTNNSAASNVVIEGNRFYDAVAVRVAQGNSGSTANPSRWMVIGNLFSNTGLSGNFSDHLTVEGNTFTGGGSTFNYINFNNSPTRLKIIDNDFDGGQYHINIGGSAMDTITIRGNTCHNWGARAINVFGTASTGSCSISNNTLTLNPTGTATDGIVCACPKWVIKDNNVTMSGGSGAGISVSGSYSVVQANTVRCGGVAPYTIRVAGGTSSVVANNTTDAAVSDAGTTTTLSNNLVLAA